MQAVIFTGVQGSGKTTFYVERFLHTHVRISLDVLKTRPRERALLETCLAMRQPFVVDNTNPRAEVRAPYIAAARQAGFHVIGYFFETSLKDALRRNAQRTGRARIPPPGRPTLPSTSCSTAAVRIICTPVVCCVQPTA